MLADLVRIQSSLPAHRRAVQWNFCFEVVGADGGNELPHDDATTGSAVCVGRFCDAVNVDIELSIHLSYGDPGH